MTYRTAVLFSLFAIFTACSDEKKPDEKPSSSSTNESTTKAIAACNALKVGAIDNPHPLHNKIYRVADKTFIGCEDLVRALADVDVVMLGEKHGETEQHKRQAVIVNGLLELGVKPALLMEMFSLNQQTILDKLNKPEKDQANKLAIELKWWKTAWPAFNAYEPMVQAAFDKQLPVIAADLPNDVQKAVREQGVEILKPELRQALKLNTLPLEAARASWATAMKKAHCDMLSEEELKHVTTLQRVRDAFMAKRILDAQAEHGKAILIAGRAHTRHDRSIPRQMARLSETKTTVLSVKFANTQPKKTDAQNYLPDDAWDKSYDYIWLAQKPSEEKKEGTCDRLKRLFGKPSTK